MVSSKWLNNARTNPSSEVVLKWLKNEEIGNRILDLFLHKIFGRCDPTAEYDEETDMLVWYEHHPEVPGGASERIEEPFPRYTTVFEESFGLVKVGCRIRCSNNPSFTSHPKWEVIIDDYEDDDDADDVSYMEYGHTPALATCATALTDWMDNHGKTKSKPKSKVPAR